jgi:hypothetical protein
MAAFGRGRVPPFVLRNKCSEKLRGRATFFGRDFPPRGCFFCQQSVDAPPPHSHPQNLSVRFLTRKFR